MPNVKNYFKSGTCHNFEVPTNFTFFDTFNDDIDDTNTSRKLAEIHSLYLLITKDTSSMSVTRKISLLLNLLLRILMCINNNT